MALTPDQLEEAEHLVGLLREHLNMLETQMHDPGATVELLEGLRQGLELVGSGPRLAQVGRVLNAVELAAMDVREGGASPEDATRNAIGGLTAFLPSVARRIAANANAVAELTKAVQLLALGAPKIRSRKSDGWLEHVHEALKHLGVGKTLESLEKQHRRWRRLHPEECAQRLPPSSR